MCDILLKVVCIPAFNEEERIADVIKKSLKFADKVIVCDDGSSDRTANVAESAGAIVIKNKKNLGKGAALRLLFEYSRNIGSDITVTIDGDGQFDPDEIPKLIRPILEGNCDIVIGYRYDSEVDMPSYRKAGNKILDKITNMAAELPFRDTQSGYRAYSKKATESIQFVTDGFGADSEILIDASKKGLKICEEKVTVIYETGGKTSTKNPVSHTGEVIASLVELVALRRPLTYLGIPGLVLIIIGIVGGVYVVSEFNVSRYFSIPYTLLSLGTLIIGAILMMIAVVLFSIVRTSKRR